MDQTHTDMRSALTKGADVYGSDGEKVGSIVEVNPTYVVVEKGFFFQTDYYIPIAAFSGVRDNRIFLNVTKDAALNQGWDARPVTATEEGPETASTRGGINADNPDLDVYINASDAAPIGTGGALGGATEGSVPIPLAAEHQPIRIERHEIGQEVGPAETVLEEELIEIPVYGDEVHTATRVRVAEEVEVGKEPVPLTATVTDTVRHEEVRVVGHVVDVEAHEVRDLPEGDAGRKR